MHTRLGMSLCTQFCVRDYKTKNESAPLILRQEELGHINLKRSYYTRKIDIVIFIFTEEMLAYFQAIIAMCNLNTILNTFTFTGKYSYMYNCYRKVFGKKVTCNQHWS